MGLDIAALIIIALFFIRGYMKGLIVAAFSVVAILLGLVVALKFSQSLAEWLRVHDYVSSAWVQVVSYMALFIGVVLLVRMVARAIEGAVEGMMLGTLNKLAGGILYALLGAILWSSLLWIGACSQNNTGRENSGIYQLPMVQSAGTLGMGTGRSPATLCERYLCQAAIVF